MSKPEQPFTIESIFQLRLIVLVWFAAVQKSWRAVCPIGKRASHAPICGRGPEQTDMFSDGGPRTIDERYHASVACLVSQTVVVSRLR